MPATSHRMYQSGYWRPEFWNQLAPIRNVKLFCPLLW